MISFTKVLKVVIFISTVLLLSAHGATIVEAEAAAEARATGAAQPQVEPEPKVNEVHTAGLGAPLIKGASAGAGEPFESINAAAVSSGRTIDPETAVTSADSVGESKDAGSRMFRLQEQHHRELETFMKALPDAMSGNEALEQIADLQKLFEKHRGEREDIPGIYRKEGMDTYLSEVSSFDGRYYSVRSSYFTVQEKSRLTHAIVLYIVGIDPATCPPTPTGRG